jgi:hypothetical protein
VNNSPVLIRQASERDAAKLHRLAVLDSADDVHVPALVAERDGSLVAAVPMDGGRAIADPFVPSADVVRLLELRRTQLEHAA